MMPQEAVLARLSGALSDAQRAIEAARMAFDAYDSTVWGRRDEHAALVASLGEATHHSLAALREAFLVDADG